MSSISKSKLDNIQMCLKHPWNFHIAGEKNGHNLSWEQ